MDLAIQPVRFGPNPIAYLVVGQAIDQAMLTSVAEETGVAVATAAGQTVMLWAPPDDSTKAVFATVVGQVDISQSRTLDVNGESFVVATTDLEESGQTRPRLVVAQSLVQPTAWFATVRWMLFAPPFLVIIGVLFALAAGRRVVVVRQP